VKNVLQAVNPSINFNYGLI